MENLDIARELTTLADLLEIQGANPFRIRAYRNAVNTIAGIGRSLPEMVAAGEDLTQFAGIGDSVAAHIVELVQTGSITRLREIEAQYPRTIVDLMALGGVGPKKARKLFDTLGVKTVEDLGAALASGAVARIEGFGPKSIAKLQEAVDSFQRRGSRFRIDEAERFIAGLLEHMRSAPGVERLEVAGSLRRRKETIGDVDLLAECDEDGAAVVEHFVRFGGASRAEAAGPTKGSILLASGLQVDLRVVPSESFGAALVYFTGSKEHNINLRTRAVRSGLRVNEWGVYRVADEAEAPTEREPRNDDVGEDGDGEREATDAAARFGERVAGDTEESVYDALGMPWIPPELRENRGEVEAALGGTLPRLIELDHLRGDLQMHSTWSDGDVSIEEMARACLARGYEYMAITDHSQVMAMVGGLTPERAREQWAEIDEARERLPEIDILRSVEIDILRDGELDMPDDILEELDLVVISVHSFMSQDKRTMTDRVLRAMSHPMVDILAHPTGRQINKREPFPLDVEAVLEAAVELSVAVELNANPRRLDLKDTHVQRAKELGVPVVISTDAHYVSELDNMRYGVEQARRGWLEQGDVLNTLSAKKLRKWLARKPT
ncbi:MAG: helix-hairpin-helix domain-containing protein [Gemmatimonadales bacterium]